MARRRQATPKPVIPVRRRRTRHGGKAGIQPRTVIRGHHWTSAFGNVEKVQWGKVGGSRCRYWWPTACCGSAGYELESPTAELWGTQKAASEGFFNTPESRGDKHIGTRQKTSLSPEKGRWIAGFDFWDSLGTFTTHGKPPRQGTRSGHFHSQNSALGPGESWLSPAKTAGGRFTFVMPNENAPDKRGRQTNRRKMRTFTCQLQ